MPFFMLADAKVSSYTVCLSRKKKVLYCFSWDILLRAIFTITSGRTTTRRESVISSTPLARSTRVAAIAPSLLYEADVRFGGFLRLAEVRAVSIAKEFPLVLDASQGASVVGESRLCIGRGFATRMRKRIFLFVRCSPESPDAVPRCFRVARNRSGDDYELDEETDAVRRRDAWNDFCHSPRVSMSCEPDEPTFVNFFEDVEQLSEHHRRALCDALRMVQQIVSMPAWSTFSFYSMLCTKFDGEPGDARNKNDDEEEEDEGASWWGPARSSAGERLVFRTCCNVCCGRVDAPLMMHESELRTANDVWFAASSASASPLPSIANASTPLQQERGGVLLECMRRDPRMAHGFHARFLIGVAVDSSRQHLRKSVVMTQLVDGRMFRFGEDKSELPTCMLERAGVQLRQDRSTGPLLTASLFNGGHYHRHHHHLQQQQQPQDSLWSDAHLLLHQLFHSNDGNVDVRAMHTRAACARVADQ